MFNNPLYAFGQYCSSLFLSAAPVEIDVAQRQQVLLQRLEQYIVANDEFALLALFTDDADSQFIAAGLKASPTSLLHMAAAQANGHVFRVLLSQLPLDVLTYHTMPMDHSPLISATQGENSMNIVWFLSAVESKMRNENPTLNALQAVQHRYFHPAWDTYRTVVDATDADQNTALMVAIRANNVDAVTALLLCNAGLSGENSAGETVHDLIAHPDTNAEIVQRVQARIQGLARFRGAEQG